MRLLSEPAAREAARLLEAEGNAITPSAILDRAKLLMDRDRVIYHSGPDGQATGPVGVEDNDGRLYCVGCLWCET